MNPLLIGTLISLCASSLLAVRNFYGKSTQVLLTLLAFLLSIVNYTFIFFSPAFIILFSFDVFYMLCYQFRKRILRFFKVDHVFILMLVLFGVSIYISVITYTGPESISGIILLFLEMFAVFIFSAQGMRYKNAFSSLLYLYMDLGVGNYFAVVLDAINLVTPIIAIFKYKGEPLLDKEMLTENVELVKLSNEVRSMKKLKNIK